METFGTSDGTRASGQRLANDIGEGVNAVKNVASAEIRNLIADVEDWYVTWAQGWAAYPKVYAALAIMALLFSGLISILFRVRNRVLRAVDAAKAGLADSADSLRRQAQQVAATADDYVHDSPWQAVGIAALVGAVVGILATRRS